MKYSVYAFCSPIITGPATRIFAFSRPHALFPPMQRAAGGEKSKLGCQFPALFPSLLRFPNLRSKKNKKGSSLGIFCRRLLSPLHFFGKISFAYFFLEKFPTFSPKVKERRSWEKVEGEGAAFDKMAQGCYRLLFEENPPNFVR